MDDVFRSINIPALERLLCLVGMICVAWILTIVQAGGFAEIWRILVHCNV